MELTMFLGGELIDSIRLNMTELSRAGFLQNEMMKMEEKNEHIIDLRGQEPQFYIENVPSAMNQGKNLYC